ncbi:MAG: DoxX family protein [Anaerolineaceae bacterium]|mgnify:FL=1|jgi:thiosulfate dehydrogenase [quinone] large subunit|nr:DoxX family protein [Anaerolineaceae bacterium]
MSTQSKVKNPVRFSDPPIANTLFNSTRWSWLWLVARVYLGYTWLNSGLGKLSNPAWTQSGEALKGFWERAVLIPDAPARPAISFDWYRAFLQSMLDSGAYTWFAKLVVAGELLIGVALILGIFTGIAAFFGGFLNWNFMMAGSASTNPVLFTISILLILAWKTAGWIGVDRWLLPALGTPWQPGNLFEKQSRE